MTTIEARAYNAGVEDMRSIAQRAAKAIEATGRRPLVEGFATAALRQLADDGAALLMPIGRPDAGTVVRPDALPIPASGEAVS